MSKLAGGVSTPQQNAAEALTAGCEQELKELSEEERKKLKAEAKKKARSAHSGRQHPTDIQGKFGKDLAHFDWALGNLGALEQ